MNMNTQSKKYVWSVAIILLILSFIFVLFFNNTTTRNNVTSRSLILNDIKNEGNIQPGSQHNDGSVVTTKVAPINKSFTQADTHDFFSWMSIRGHFSNQERQDYEHYDQKTLEALADNGDLKAIDALGDLYLNKGDAKTAAIYFERGAVRGSTFAIETLGIILTPGVSTQEENRRSQVLESLAMIKTMALRGDDARADMENETLIKHYEYLYETKLDLTQEEQQQIDKRATDIYNTWQEKRREMGLGDFDNSQPRGVKNFFGLFK